VPLIGRAFSTGAGKGRKFQNLTVIKDIGNRFSHNLYTAVPIDRYLTALTAAARRAAYAADRRMASVAGNTSLRAACHHRCKKEGDNANIVDDH